MVHSWCFCSDLVWEWNSSDSLCRWHPLRSVSSALVLHSSQNTCTAGAAAYQHVWTHHPNGPCMCDGINPKTKQPQSFYFPEDHPKYPGWFEGMEQIIHECSLWPKNGLSVECTGPKRPEGQANCCCRHLLYTQSDFMSQKPLLQECIESRGHLCDYYPKYHCELNFIKQYWGAAKLHFCIAGCAQTLGAMEKTMLVLQVITI